MSIISKYIVTRSVGANYIDLNLDYGTVTLIGSEVVFSGSTSVDAVYVRPGLTVDMSNTKGSADKIYLQGSWLDYVNGGTVSLDSATGIMTLTRTLSGLTETVKFIKATNATASDVLIFADGKVSTFDIYSKLAAAQPLTGLTPSNSETSVTPSIPTVLNATIKAVAVDPSTFAGFKPGVVLEVSGSSGVDVVYVNDGSVIDASNLKGSVDKIYFRGTWEEYTKTVDSISGNITFTRPVMVNNVSVQESVITAGGNTAAARDQLIFANGTVTADKAKAAIIATPSTGGLLTDVQNNNPAITTPGISDITKVTIGGVGPGSDNTYALGDVIEFNVSLKSAISLSGSPVFTFKIGTTNVTAVLDTVNSTLTGGTPVLKFKHTVTALDGVDTNGISYAANAITGGAITVTSTNAAAKLSHSALADLATQLVDGTVPTLLISSDVPGVKAGETANITFTFSEDPGSSFAWNGTTGDVVVTGGTLSAISGTGLTRTAVFTPGLASGDVRISVAAGNYTDAASNPGGAGLAPALIIDYVSPTLAIRSNLAEVVYGETATISFIFSEVVSNFALSNVVATNGKLSNLTTLDGKVYTATFTPTSGLSAAIARITVPSISYQDVTGNPGSADVYNSLLVNTFITNTATIARVVDNSPNGTVIGDLTSGASTDDTTLDLSGSTKTALGVTEQVVVYSNINGAISRLGSATAAAGTTTWSYTTSSLAKGDIQFTVRVEDTVVATRGPASNIWAQKIQSVAIAGINDNVGLAQGQMATGSGSDDLTPTITGTLSTPLATGEEVAIYAVIGGAAASKLGVATTVGNSWSFTPTADLAIGSYVLTGVVQTAGNSDVANALVVSSNYNVALTAPVDVLTSMVATLAISDNSIATSVYSTNAGSAGGSLVASGTSTDDVTPIISGTYTGTLGANEKIRIYNNDAYLGDASPNITTNTWSYTLPSAARILGVNTFSAKVVNTVVNLNGPAVSDTVLINSVSMNYDIESKVLTGSLGSSLDPAKERLSLYKGSTFVGVINVAADQSWSYNLSAFNGTLDTFKVSLEDLTGTTVKLARSMSLAVGSAEPQVLNFNITDDSSVTTAYTTNAVGVVANGSSTDDTTPTLSGSYSGTLSGAQSIRIYDNGTYLKDATLNTVNNSWSTTTAALASGRHVLSAKVYDSTTGLANAGISNTALIQTMGSASVVSDNASLVLQLTKSARYVMVARQGNGSWFIFSEVQIMSGGVNVALGKTATAYANNSNMPSFAIDGASSSVYSSGDSPASTVMQWWQVDLGADYDIESISITSSSASGAKDANVFLASNSVGSLSSKTSVTAVATTAGVVNYGTTPNSSGTATFQANGFATADNTPTFMGKLATGLLAGEVLAVYDDATLLGDAIVAVDGSWSYTHTGTALTVGTHIIYAKLQDAAHTTTKLAQSYELQVRSTAAPAAAVSTLVVTDDSSLSASNSLTENAIGTVASGTSTDDTTPKLSGAYTGTLAEGEKIQIFDNGVLLGNATTVDVVNRTWTYDISKALSTGSHVFTAKTINALTTMAQTVNIPSSTALIQTMGTFGAVSDNPTLVQSQPLAKTARYVMVARQGDGSSWFSFEEVQVMSGGVNVALGKTATAYASNSNAPSRAIDGTAGGTVYSSGGSALPTAMQWWQVDLGQDYEVDFINFVSFTPSNSSKANIFLSSTSVGSQTTKTSVAAIAATTGVVTYGPTPVSGGVSVYLSTAFSTADGTPTLTGKLSTGLLAGEVLAVYDGATFLGDATVSADGNWTYAHTGAAFSAGVHSIIAKVQDTAHTTTKLAQSYDLKISGVSTPTAAVTSLVITDDSGNAASNAFSTNTTGVVASGTSTDDFTPKVSGEFTGTLAAGEVIQIFDNGTFMGNATKVDSLNGTWSYDLASLSSPGSHVFTAKVVNGMTYMAQTVGVPSSTALVQNVGTLGVVTDNATPVLVQPITRTARYVMIARQGTGTSWFIFKEVEVMSAGINVALGKTATAYASNTNAPIMAVDGSIDSVYSSGHAAATNVMQWWQVDLGQDYDIDSINFTPSSTSEGANAGIYLAPASVGSLSTKTSVGEVGVTPGVVTYGTTTTSSLVSSYTNTVLTTVDNTPTLTGKLAVGLAAGERLAVYSPTDTYLGDATVAADGTWSFLVTGALPIGIQTLRIKLQDSVGTTTRLAFLFEVSILSIDGPTSAVSSLVVTDDISATASNAYSINASTAVATGTTTDDTKPTFSGTLSKPLDGAESVVLYDGTTVLGSALVKGTTWSFTPATPLAIGSHAFSAQVVNPVTQLFSPFVGSPVNVTISSLIWNTLEVDRGLVQGNLMINGNSGTAMATSDDSLDLAGTLGAVIDAAKERVAIYDGGVLLGTATVSGTAWSFTASNLSMGMHPLEVRLENISTGVASLARAQNVQIISSSTTPTTVVAALLVSDDSSVTNSLYKAGNATGALSSGMSTDDTTPTLSGGLSAPLLSGEVVQVFDGSTYLGMATVNGALWTYTPTALNALKNGTHTLSAKVVNTASGNASASLSTDIGVQAMNNFSITPQGGTAKSGQFIRYIMVHQGAVSSPEVFEVGFVQIFGVNNVVLNNMSSISWSTSDTSKVPVTINGSSNPQYLVTYNPRYPDTGYTTALPTSEAWIQIDLGADYELSSVALGNVDVGTRVYASTQSMTANPSLSALQSGTNGAALLGQVSSSLAGIQLGLATFTVPQGVVTTQVAATVSGQLGATLATGTNERVGIYVDDVYQGAATLNGTAWSYNLSGLTVGNHIVKAQVEDKVTGVVRLAQSQTLGVSDTLTPTTLAAITSMSDDVGAQTGTVASGNSTDDTTIGLMGTLSANLKPGEVVQVLDGTNVLGNAIVKEMAWSFTTPTLAYQSHSLTAKVVNATTGLSGTASTATTVLVQNPDITLSVDTGTLAQNPKSVRYVMVARNWSDPAYLAINEIEVMSGGVNVALGKSVAGPGWSTALQGYLPSTAAVDGSTFWGSAYLYNEAIPNGIRYIQIDLGDFYQIDSIKITSPSDRGTLNSAKVYLSGTSMILLQSELALNAVPNVTLVATLNANLVQTIDTTGAKVGANYATDTTPTLSGILGTNLATTERLAVYDGTTYLGNATITNTTSGAWTFTVPAGSALVSGTHTLMARVESLDGTVIKASATELLNLTVAAPTADLVSAYDTGYPSIGSVQVKGNLTAALAGGQRLGVYDGTTLLGYATTNGNLWSYYQAGLGLGTHALTAKVTDELGTLGASGSGLNVTITGTLPTQLVTVSGAVETTGEFAYTGHLLPNQSVADPLMSLISTDTTPGVWGKLSSNLGSGESLVAYDGKTALAGTMVVNGTSWNFVPTSPLSEGFHNLSFRVENGANQGTASKIFGVEVDAVVGNLATVLNLIDNQGALTGNLAVGGITDDVFLVLSGKLDFAQQGTIKVFDGTTQISTQYSALVTDNIFNINVPQLGVGSHTLSLKFYNTNGVEQTSAASSQTVNVVIGDSGQITSMTTSAGGVDTLTLSNYGQTMDFTKLGTSTIDKVDLGSFGGNTVKLSTADVLDAGTNLFNTAGGWTFSNVTDSTHAATYHQMVLDGTGTTARGSSTVTLTETAAAINTLSPWALTGTATHDGSTYNVYTNVVTDNAQVLINQNLAVSNILI